MTPEQFDLATHSPWLTLWLISDFDTARSHAVSGSSGGTFYCRGVRGHFQTEARGITWRGGDIEESVTWSETRRWSDSLSADVKQQAAQLREAGQEIQRTYPSQYPGIGRPYCWDVRDDRHSDDDCRQCAIDREDLDAANARRDAEREAWHQRNREHETQVRALIASLRPDDEPADLLDLLEAM